MKYNMSCRIIALLAIIVYGSMLSANDGVYHTSGNFLIPIKETDISAKKEILTITICKDGYADVDVDYTFFNNSNESKSVTMAFEANAPYNAGEPLRRDGKHPNISLFTVEMNGAKLSHRNAVVAMGLVNDRWVTDHAPLDMTQWKGYGEVADTILPADDAIYNETLDSVTCFAYAYYFDATFQPGENKVHHTYRYKMSYSVGCRYEINYWLTPVTRWANGQVDDFTLRVKTDGDIENITMVDTLFKASDFTFRGMQSAIYHLKHDWRKSFIFATVSDKSVLEWHSTNFSPDADMSISAGDELYSNDVHQWDTEAQVVIDKDGNAYHYLADTDDGYFILGQDYAVIPKNGARVETLKAEKGQGFLHLNDHTKAANVRVYASTKNPVMCVIKNTEGMMPETYRCLGLVKEYLPNGDFKQWFRILVNGKPGYVSRDLMIWDPCM